MSLVVGPAHSCIDVNNYKNTKLVLWDRAQSKGIMFGDTTSGYISYKTNLQVTSDFSQALEVIFNDQDNLLIYADQY